MVEDVLDLAELQAYLDRALFSSMVASWLDGNYEPRVAPLLFSTVSAALRVGGRLVLAHTDRSSVVHLVRDVAPAAARFGLWSRRGAASQRLGWRRRWSAPSPTQRWRYIMRAAASSGRRRSGATRRCCRCRRW